MTAVGGALVAQVAGCLQRHIQPASRLTVGYSGGLDSSVLLQMLAGLRNASTFSPGFSLSAVHVHHGLSSQADAWAQHCAKVCHELAVPLEIHRVDVQPAGEGLEAAARGARYQVYSKLDTDFLVLAHHRDDQAETVLLQLLRGSGLKGLAAMPEARLLSGKRVILRPLLAAYRAEISAWAIAHRLAWIEDESNVDVRLARNALRHEVLPPLVGHFANAPRVLAQAAVQFAEAAAMLDALADLDGRDAITAEGLAIPVLRDLTEPRARNLLRRFLEYAGVEIHQESLHESLRQLLSARQDAQVRVEWSTASDPERGKFALRRFRQWATLDRVPQAAGQNGLESLIWRGETCLNLSEAGVLSGCLYFQTTIGSGVRLTPGKVTIRPRLGGERLRPGPGRPRRTLKNLLREAEIPAWQRAVLPLIFVDEALAWAAPIGADSDYLAKAGEAGWLISWQVNPDKAA